MQRFLTVLCVLSAVFVLAAGPALAGKSKGESPVDMTGVWKGTSTSVAMGALGHTEASQAPKFVHVDFTITIEKQDGPTFYGTKTSAKGKETVLGVIDGWRVSMVDDDGVYRGKLTSKNKLNLTYLEAGTTSKVASVTEYRREKKADASEK